MSDLPRILEFLYTGEIDAAGSIKFSAHRPEPNLVVVVILAKWIQVLRVIMDRKALAGCSCRCHFSTESNFRTLHNKALQTSTTLCFICYQYHTRNLSRADSALYRIIAAR